MTTNNNRPRESGHIRIALIAIAVGVSLWIALRATEPTAPPPAGAVAERRYIDVGDGQMRLVCGDGSTAVLISRVQYCNVAPGATP